MKFYLAALSLMMATAVEAANPSFSDFDTNWFNVVNQLITAINIATTNGSQTFYGAQTVAGNFTASGIITSNQPTPVARSIREPRAGESPGTNHMIANVGGRNIDFWSDGVTVWAIPLAPPFNDPIQPGEYATKNYVDQIINTLTDYYFRGDLTNSVNTNSWILSSDYRVGSLATITKANVPLNSYPIMFQSTNVAGMGFLDSGLALVDFDAARGSGVLGITPEMDLITNGVVFRSFTNATEVVLTANRTHYRSQVVIESRQFLPFGTQFRLKFRASTSGSTPTLLFYSGFDAISHLGLPTISGATLGGLTANIQILTALPSTFSTLYVTNGLIKAITTP